MMKCGQPYKDSRGVTTVVYCDSCEDRECPCPACLMRRMQENKHVKD